MIDRRTFCKQMGAFGLASILPDIALGAEAEKQKKNKKDEMIWAYLVHLGYNMWEDTTPDKYKVFKSSFDAKETAAYARYYHPELTCDLNVWDRVMVYAAKSGVNMMIVDLGDGVRYDSHPEIAVRNAISTDQLRALVKRIRDLGMEPIPKLNFSCGHKAWLHEYQYMISSKTYYKVCADLINEAMDIFDSPRFLHLGMDEETCSDQGGSDYTVVRRGDLWWKDFYYLVDLVEKRGGRAWIWSDNLWRHKDEFLSKMPKSVIQSNWNYEDTCIMFDENGKPGDVRAQSFIDLEEAGFDQVPTGSLWLRHIWNNYENFDRLVKNNKRIVDPSRLKGFMQTIWMPTLKPCESTHYEALDLVKKAREKYYGE